MTEKDAIRIACELLNLKGEENKNISFIDELNAFYFSEPVKGGASLIIADDGEVLYANSSVRYDDHINAFKNGVRTPLSAFK